MKAKKKIKTCPAKVGVKVNNYDPHTFPCMKPAGHEGMHEWKKDGVTRLWPGPAEDRSIKSEKYRFGRWLSS